MLTYTPPKPLKTPEPIIYDPRKRLDGYPNTLEDKNIVLKVKNARAPLFSKSKYANLVKRLLTLTLTEKIWYSHLEAGDPLKKGSIIYLKPDLLLIQDATGKLLLLQAELLFKLLGKEQTDILTVLYYDHNIKVDFGIEQAIIQDKEGIKFLGTSASKRGIIFSLPGNGICHRVSDEYFDIPGGVLFGSDSHTPTAGGMGMFSLGKGGWSIAKSLAAGLGMPIDRNPIIGVHLKGSLPDGIEPKQIVQLLNRDIIRLFGNEGNGSYIEFFGEGIKSVSVVGRSSITNSLVDGGMGTGLFPPDEQVIKYLESRKRVELAKWVRENIKDLNPDPEVLKNPEKYYDKVLEYDLSKEIHPALAMPGNPKNVFYLDEIPNVVHFINEEILSKHTEFLTDGKVDKLKIQEFIGTYHGTPILRATPVETLINFTLQEIDIKKSFDKRKLSIEISSGSIGSCTHSGKDDIEAAVWANIQLAKNKVKRSSPVSVTYGSRDGWLSVQSNKTIQDSIKEGHLILLDSACGPCIGMGFTPQVDTAAIRSFNRNFFGRAGTKEKIDQVYLASPAITIYLAACGRLDTYDPDTKSFITKDESGKEVKIKLINPTSEATFLNPVVDNDFNDPNGKRVAFILPSPKEEAKSIEVLYDGETIAALPNDIYDIPPGKFENIPVLVALGDNVTTDDLSAAGIKYIPKRGNLLELELGFFESIASREQRDPQFYYNLAKEYKKKYNGSVMIGGKLFGSGSSREAAAFIPRHLRARVAIAESFAPIHRENAIEQGLLYLTFKNSGDRTKLDPGDQISIHGLDKLDPDKRDIEVKIKKKEGKEFTISCEHVLDTPYKIEIFRAGSEPNLFKKILIDKFKGDVKEFMQWFSEKSRL